MARQRPAKNNNSTEHALPQHDGGSKIKDKKINTAVMALVQALQPTSVNPNNAWYSLASQYNKSFNADRFYTPRRFTLLCIKTAG